MPIPPYGGELVDRYVSREELSDEIRSSACESLVLGNDDLINLVNLATGGYSPLTGFMGEAEYTSVTRHRRLPSGQAWTIPILLRLRDPLENGSSKKTTLMLLDSEGVPVGDLQLEGVFTINKDEHAAQVFGTNSTDHPGVRHSSAKPEVCAGGPVRLSRDFLKSLRLSPPFSTPEENRSFLLETGKTSFTAFSTRNVCHLGHRYLHTLALETTDILGINVITGAEVNGSFLPEIICDTYQYLIDNQYPEGHVFLNNLRLPPTYGGPKEAFLQATVLQNLGFTHFIVGRDHAGVGDYYPKYGSQEIFEELPGLSITILPISEPRYCGVCDKVTTEKSCRHGGAQIRELNGRDVRRFLTEKNYSKLREILGAEMQLILTGMLDTKSEEGMFASIA